MQKPTVEVLPIQKEFWAYAQKLLSFEEPQIQWAQQGKTVCKYFKHGKTNTDTPTEAERDAFADEVLDCSHSSLESRLLSVVIALDVTDRFEDVAFSIWKKVSKFEGKDAKCDTTILHALRHWSVKEDVSKEQLDWLTYALCRFPNWELLRAPGPWLNDARCALLLDCLNAYSSIVRTAEQPGAVKLEVSDIARARKVFYERVEKYRGRLVEDFCPNVLALVEGATETIVLPALAKLSGADFRTLGVQLISAGGSKQVFKRYLEIRDTVRLPVVAVLDRDATEQADLLNDMLRECDRLFVFQSGEIEDAFPLEQFVFLLNVLLSKLPGNPPPVAVTDFPPADTRKNCVARLWKQRMLGAFDKVAFAESVASNLVQKESIPREVAALLDLIKSQASNPH